MNFVRKILEAGFVEQGQLKSFKSMPHKEKMIPKWWENYDTSRGWLGVDVYYPDAWFTKEGFDGELQLSLQGLLTPFPVTKEDDMLMDNVAVRYISLIVGGKKVYETFSGKFPPENIVDDFIKASIQP